MPDRPNPHARILRFPMHDTGLGKEAGYKNDAAMVDAVRAERAAMAPEVRAVLEDVDRWIGRALLFGEPF